jgi:hypothetical protein
MGSAVPPTVGRVVHFVNGFGEHEAAIVTYVLDGSQQMVNLCAFTKDGAPEPHTSASYDGTGAMHYSWHWPEGA